MGYLPPNHMNLSWHVYVVENENGGIRRQMPKIGYGDVQKAVYRLSRKTKVNWTLVAKRDASNGYQANAVEAYLKGITARVTQASLDALDMHAIAREYLARIKASRVDGTE